MSCPACGSDFSLITDETTAFPESSPESIGHFRLLEKLGSGGFGIVWRAYDGVLDRTVAVKIPRRERLDPHEAEHFLREARAAAQLKHPSIVGIHEVGRHGDTVYIVSDYVDGVTLADRLTVGPLAVREAAEVCAKVAEALHHAHVGGVIHRDLKPSNIIVDAAGDPHVMDFGLARREAGEVTVTVDGKIVGTPAYMSPEQARGEGHLADRRSDVYSLGVMLFELLTGEKPFRGNVRMMLNQVLHDEAPSPRKLNASIPRDLETICLKCLEKKPELRYQSAGDLARDLRAFLNGEPTLARPISPASRGWRWCQRNRVIAGLAASLLVTLLAGLAGVTAQWLRAEKEAGESRMYAAAARDNAIDAEQNAIRERDQARQATQLAKRLGDSLASEERARSIAAAEAEKARQAAASEAAGRRLTRRSLYAAQMNLAWQAWEQANLGRVHELLDAQLPAADDEDLRSFEWYHLWWQSHRYSLSIEGAYFFAWMSLATDGRTLALRSGDGVLSLWDLEQGRELSHIDLRNGPVTLPAGPLSPTVALSPDAKTAAMPGDNHIVELRDLASGAVLRIYEGLTSPVRAIAMSPSGEQIAAGSDAGTLIVWNAADGRTLWTGQASTAAATAEKAVKFVGYAPSGDSLVTGTLDAVEFWDVKTGDRNHLDYHPFFAPVPGQNPVQFSTNGKALVFLDTQMRLVIHDVVGGRNRVIPTNPSDELQTFAVSPDGQTVAAGGRVLKFFSSVGGEEQAPLPPVPATLITRVAFMPDGKTLAAAHFNGTIRLHDTASGTIRQSLPGHTNVVFEMIMPPDGRTLISRSLDGSVKVWDIAGGSRQTLLERHPRAVKALTFPADGTLLSIDEGGTVKRWNIESAQADSSHDLMIDGTAPPDQAAFDFSPDGAVVAVRTTDLTVRIVAVSGGQPKLSYKTNLSSGSPVVFSPDGSLVAGIADERIHVWEVESGRERWQLNETLAFATLAILPDNQTIIAIDLQAVRVWNMADGSERKPLANSSSQVGGFMPNVSVLSPDARRLACGASFGLAEGKTTIKIWDLDTGAVEDMPRGHAVAVIGLKFSHDSKTLFSTSLDVQPRIKLWNVAVREELTTLAGVLGNPPAAALALSRDGKLLMQGNLDGTISLWRAATEADVAGLRIRRASRRAPAAN